MSVEAINTEPSRLLRRTFLNPLMVVIDVVFGLLIVTCLNTGAFVAAAYVGAFIVTTKLAFLGFMALLHRGKKRTVLAAKAPPEPKELERQRRFIVIAGLLIGIVGMLPVLGVFYRLGFIPGLAAVRTLDYDLLVILRNTSFEISKGWHLYTLEYALRAVLPLAVFMLFLSRSLVFWPMLLLAVLAAMSVMAKIYPIILVAPLMLYCLFAGRLAMAAGFMGLLGLVLAVQITMTNPSMKLPILVSLDTATRDFILDRGQAAETPKGAEQAATPPKTFEADDRLRAQIEAAKLPEPAAPDTGVPKPAVAPASVDVAAEMAAMRIARRQVAIEARTEKEAEQTAGSGGQSGLSYLSGVWAIWSDRIMAISGGLGKAVYKSAEAVYIRMFEVPGEVMNQWFTTIPSKQPHLGLCGYRVLALIIGCEYIHSPRRVFEIVYADTYVKRGIIGNLNAPGFVMDYANLGWLGVVLSAVLLAFIIAVFSSIFSAQPAFLAVLVPYFALTTEAPISLIMNSGGLGLAAVILFVFRGPLLNLSQAKI